MFIVCTVIVNFIIALIIDIHQHTSKTALWQGLYQVYNSIHIDIHQIKGQVLPLFCPFFYPLSSIEEHIFFKINKKTLKKHLT